ncbi:MAG: helix-turn-helix domain-containing protein [Caulobacterales bacterium]
MVASELASERSPPPATPFDALRRIPWLSDVPCETLRGLADQSVLHRAPAGVQLFEQAETPSFAQFLLAGGIELLAVRDGDETLVELVGPFDLLLPAAVLTRQPYLVRARVHKEAQLLLVRAETFCLAVATDHRLCLAVLACQAAQFRRQMKLAKTVRLRSAEERIGAYLVGIAEAAGGAGEIRLPLGKRLIASQLGMTRETFSRALPAIARHGLRVVGDTLHAEDLNAARSAFPHDPLIDGPEPVRPLTPYPEE